MKRLGVALAILLLLCAPTRVQADVAPPDGSDCRAKKIAADCTMDNGARGQCAEITWSFINYGPNGPDGSRQERMLVCKPAPPLLEGVPFGSWIIGIGISLLVATTGLFLVLYRRRRPNS